MPVYELHTPVFLTCMRHQRHAPTCKHNPQITRPLARDGLVFVKSPDRCDYTGPAPAPRLCCIASQRHTHAVVLPACQSILSLYITSSTTRASEYRALPATVPSVCCISIRRLYTHTCLHTSLSVNTAHCMVMLYQIIILIEPYDAHLCILSTTGISGDSSCTLHVTIRSASMPTACCALRVAKLTKLYMAEQDRNLPDWPIST
jgi:hypothetical protein